MAFTKVLLAFSALLAFAAANFELPEGPHHLGVHHLEHEEAKKRGYQGGYVPEMLGPYMGPQYENHHLHKKAAIHHLIEAHRRASHALETGNVHARHLADLLDAHKKVAHAYGVAHLLHSNARDLGLNKMMHHHDGSFHPHQGHLLDGHQLGGHHLGGHHLGGYGGLGGHHYMSHAEESV